MRSGEMYYWAVKAGMEQKKEWQRYFHRMKAAEAKVKDLEFMIAVLEEENKKLKNDITPMQNL